MAFNGSGTFERLRSWVADRDAGIAIEAAKHDAEDDGFATGLSTCITKDGQTTITANIPFNSFKITGLAAGTSAGDSVRYEQVAKLSTANSFTADQTITGTLKVDRGATAAVLVLDADAGQERQIRLSSADSNRWLIGANSTAEGGSNAGSDFEIKRRADDGTALGTALTITRSSGAATFEDAVQVRTFSSTGASNGKNFVTSSSILQSSRDQTTTANHHLFYNPNGEVGGISTNGTATSFNTSSDERLKTFGAYSLQPGSLIDDVAALLAPFTWNKTGEAAYGLSAQALHKIAPFAVSPGDDETGTLWGVDPSKLMWHLIAYTKQLEQRVAALEAQ